MASSPFDQLATMMTSPYGLGAIVLGVVLVYYSRKSAQMAWLLLALCCFAASLSEFRDQWTPEAPPLVFPLQQIRTLGRPLAIALLGLLLWIGLETKNKWRRQLTPNPFKYLIALHAVILLKTIAYGNIAFALMAAITFGAVIVMMRMGPCQWLQDDGNFRLAVRSVAISGLIFVGLNGYQALFDSYPITFVHGLFLGTTGNPQHAATLLATTIPCLIFLIEDQPTWNWAKLLWIAGLIGVLVALFLTGSRTGLIMGVVSILMFYRRGGGKLLMIGVGIAVLLAIIMPLIGQESMILDTFSNAADKYASVRNTRAGVWGAMWHNFNTYPLFGAPLRGDRLGYGENSWLATGASLGIVGLIPLTLFGMSCGQMLWRLYRIAQDKPYYFRFANPIITGVLSLFTGSIFEAFLLGTITFPLLVLLLYLSLGQYLIEFERAERQQILPPMLYQDPGAIAHSPASTL
jgi:hypothetical protein